MSENEVVFTAENFKEQTSNGVAVVDFWAPWCGPCYMQAPVIDSIAQKYGEKVTIGKCNVDEAQSIAVELGIQSIPTLIIFKDGEIADKMVGVQSENVLSDKLDSLLAQ